MSSQGMIITGAVVVLIAVLLGAVALNQRQAQLAPAETPMMTEEDAMATLSNDETPAEKPYIEREQVEGLYYGLQYADVEALFGAEADAVDTEYDPGVNGYTAPFIITWYVWNNEDGSQARLGFVKDKLYRKQFITKQGTPALPEPVDVTELE